MPQFFSRTANAIFRLTLLGIVLAIAVVAWIGALVVRSPYETMQDVPRDQPIPFSHAHHAGGLGIDCRYCHTSVENSSFANIPATKICMNCHSQMWAVAGILQPLRNSYWTDESVNWIRVHDLPDFVYFNHAIHVHQGIGCETCHGRVDRMPLMWQANSLTMQWCLNCHRNPAQFIRPRDRVFDMEYQPPKDQLAFGARLVRAYHVQKLTSCSTCHR